MNLYSKSYLEGISKEKGFIRDNLEKVMRLSEVLKFINSSPLLSPLLVLKGGTAINLTIFQMPRLSVDIDLDFALNCSREEMLHWREKVNREVLSFMSRAGYLLKPSSKNPHTLDSWVFSYINAGGNKDSIKVEINYSDRCHVLPVVERNITIDFLGDIKVKALSPIELYASKINALIHRAAVRDIYDVYGMLNAHLFSSSSDRIMLRKILVFYLSVGSSCKAEDVALNSTGVEQIKAIGFSNVRAQLIPVLSRKDNFDFVDAKTEVIKFLSDFMVFETSEKSYIESFNRREYRPDLLFEDSDIIERIANHPMALWKCRPKE